MTQQRGESAKLGDRTRSAVLGAVRRYDPDFATALTAGHGFLTIDECLRVWDALMDELDVLFGGGPESASSPLGSDPGLVESVLDEMADFKRAVLAGHGVTL